MSIVLFGAFLLICGVLYTLWEALARRRLSDPSRLSRNGAEPTLEPRRQGLGFLGLTRNWPGVALMVVGGICLLYGAAFS
ncbi:hypothetical protein PYH37_004320 [Sinorhizobium numidicum]|uniref:Uncharacterized protein n=1 Tax=Sinorhizobium numidicum TaxID=680248 RepID=A0ABY8CZ52_9HYPH|nr:hypothetical protein [Sinorhizobium numidicum]WEX76053.1 hypothetical protein PYH37_004320 [Sinorhizobium numidicum]WEX82712.1 hypothetical protein PYH38_005032 [Sinorhizobium numidicum]